MSDFADITELSPWEEGRLIRGKRYRVAKEFVDFDQTRHCVGEEWIFVASIFSPYDDLLLIGVRSMNGDESGIQLHRAQNDQKEVMDNFANYVVPVS